MTPLLLCVVSTLAVSATPPDEVLPDGTVHHRFDYALMAKITARNAEKRLAMKEWDYDPVTWLPVPKEKPKPARPYKRDDSAVRQARMHRAAMRRQQKAASVSTWWVVIPTPNPRCPFASVVMPVSY